MAILSLFSEDSQLSLGRFAISLSFRGRKSSKAKYSSHIFTELASGAIDVATNVTSKDVSRHRWKDVW
jgi:hypothetical protein